MPVSKPTILDVSASGQIGGDKLRRLSADGAIVPVAAVRLAAKIQALHYWGVRVITKQL